MRIIAIEEHFWSRDFRGGLRRSACRTSPDLMRRLEDVAELRLGDMDAAGHRPSGHLPRAPGRTAAEAGNGGRRLPRRERTRWPPSCKPRPAVRGLRHPAADPSRGGGGRASALRGGALGFCGGHALRHHRRSVSRRSPFFWPIHERAARSGCRSTCIPRCRIPRCATSTTAPMPSPTPP